MPWTIARVEADLRDVDDPDRVPDGRRDLARVVVVVEAVGGAPGLRPLPGLLRAELRLELGLLPGLVDAGAPELVGDEQQDQDPDRDEGAPDAADDPSHRRSVGGVDAATGAGGRRRARPQGAGFDHCRRGSVHSSALVAPHPGPRRLACRSSSDSAPPCASSDGSRPSPASTSTSTRGRSCCSPGPTAPARPRCCGSSPASSRSTRARPRCSASTSPGTAARPVGSSRSSATRPSATTT